MDSEQAKLIQMDFDKAVKGMIFLVSAIEENLPCITISSVSSDIIRSEHVATQTDDGIMDIKEDVVIGQNIKEVWPVDDVVLEIEVNGAKIIKDKVGDDFLLIAFKIDNWNNNLSPWQAPAVFGNEGFGQGANETLLKVLSELNDSNKKYYIGGYSLAGLFALWASFNTNKFIGVASASPSIWFPKFIDYMKDNSIKTSKVYLSLGDKEEKTRNPLMVFCLIGWKEKHM